MRRPGVLLAGRAARPRASEPDEEADARIEIGGTRIARRRHARGRALRVDRQRARGLRVEPCAPRAMSAHGRGRASSARAPPAEQPRPPDVAVVVERARAEQGAERRCRCRPGGAREPRSLGPARGRARRSHAMAAMSAINKTGDSRKAKPVPSKSTPTSARASAPAASAGRNGRMPAAEPRPGPGDVEEIDACAVRVRGA